MTTDTAAMKLQEIPTWQERMREHFESGNPRIRVSSHFMEDEIADLRADRAAMTERLADMTGSYHLAVDSVGKLQQEVDSLSTPAAQHKGAPVATFEGFVDGQPRFSLTGEALKVGMALYAGAALACPSPAPAKSVGEDAHLRFLMGMHRTACIATYKDMAKAITETQDAIIAHIDSLLAALHRDLGLAEMAARAEADNADHWKDAYDKLAARTVADAPAGWRLVPIEPTEAMCEALTRYPQKHPQIREEYRAMLAAAPAAADQPAHDVSVRDALENLTSWVYQNCKWECLPMPVAKANIAIRALRSQPEQKGGE